MKEDLTIEEVEKDLKDAAKLLRDDFDEKDEERIGMGIFTLSLISSVYQQRFNKTEDDVKALVEEIVPELFS